MRPTHRDEAEYDGGGGYEQRSSPCSMSAMDSRPVLLPAQQDRLEIFRQVLSRPDLNVNNVYLSATQTHGYRRSSFFVNQLKAFSVWLDMGPDHRGPPEQLAVMLRMVDCR